MTMTLGGITVADPDVPAEIERVFTGQQTEAHNGTLLTDYTNVKWKWRLQWSYLTAAEYAAILARTDPSIASQAMVSSFDATSYTVVVKQETVKCRPEPSSDYWHIEFDVEELV